MAEQRINRDIRAPRVMLIGPAGENLGERDIAAALAFAQDAELDLVEVAPAAKPPVCRIMDLGKLRFTKEKRKAPSVRVGQMAEIKLHVNIGAADLAVKAKKVGQLLGEGRRVKVLVAFRGREISHQELGAKLLREIGSMILGDVMVEPVARDGHVMSMVLSPRAKRA